MNNFICYLIIIWFCSWRHVSFSLIPINFHQKLFKIKIKQFFIWCYMIFLSHNFKCFRSFSLYLLFPLNFTWVFSVSPIYPTFRLFQTRRGERESSLWGLQRFSTRVICSSSYGDCGLVQVEASNSCQIGAALSCVNGCFMDSKWIFHLLNYLKMDAFYSQQGCFVSLPQ